MPRNKAVRVWSLAGVTLLLGGGLAFWWSGSLATIQTGNKGAGAPAQGFNPVTLLKPLPPITKFPIQPARQVANQLNPSELVIGVTVEKESRAYPINMLTGPSREILNDELGGKAIAVTW
jgi:hypothetical protein